MSLGRARAAWSAARGGFVLGLCVWCCSLYEGRTLEFFPERAQGVECTSSSQCPRDQTCVGGACRECLVDADCGRDRPACVGNVCVECRTAGDCPSGQSCNPVLSTCSFSCDDASDCAGQPLSRCSGELDLCVQCLDDSDCSEPRAPACASGGGCVECSEDDDCPPDRPSCETASQRCVECLDAGQCDGRACDPRDHRCVECVSDADCGAGSCDLERRRCREACAGPEGCDDPKRPICDAVTASCIECNTREDCSEARRPACTPEHECVECLSDEDCSAPEKPACLMASKRCGQCSRDSHCGPDRRCDLPSARCVPRPGPMLEAPAGPPDAVPGPGRPGGDAGAP
jgi:Cys-rich repeat protein